MQKISIIIPARLGSTRFPNKPLAKINNREMILHVCDKAKETGIDNIIVACCEDKVFQLVTNNGYKAIMTDPNLPSGTDRIHQALNNYEKQKELDIIVNLQGDLPNINPIIINKTIETLINTKSDISTAVTPITEKNLEKDPNIVKAVINFENNKFAKAHYFSRSPIPYNAPQYYEHIGIYAYTKSALDKFISLKPSYLEKCEKLEQLRAIENNMSIYSCQIAPEQKPISVDTKEDLELINKL